MYAITLKKVEEVADRTRMFVFSKPEGFSFLAGQYAMLRIPEGRLTESDARGGMRPFSIASAPDEPELAFVMREGVSGFKKTMWDLSAGEEIALGGPLGRATVPEGDLRPVAILAGGVGIAPARAMIRDAVAKGDGRKYVLFYSNRTVGDAPFHEELLATDLPGFIYVWTLTQTEAPPSAEGEERGYIGSDMIRKYLPEWEKSLYYVIGAPAFSDAMKTVLTDMSVSGESVHMDPFSGLTGPGK